MDIYIVERELPGITREQLAGAQGAAISTSQQFTVQGTPVRHIRSTLVPDESDVNTAAKLPFARIVRALDLTPAMLLIFTGFVFASACGRSPVAPSQRAGLAAATTIASSSAAACTNIDAHVTATLQPGGTATGSISGDITGPVTATITDITPSGEGNGTLHVLMEHHYTNASPAGRLDTSDHAVLAPIDKSEVVYRMNNRLTIIGGDGIFADATGDLTTHGTVDFGTGAIDLTLKGRVCR